MSTQYVAIDLEAGAGADGQDEIIELAAVRFTADEVVASWSSLVRPRHAVGLRAAVITGITDDQLALAPTFEEVATRFQTFVGDEPIIAHSIEFDLERLRRAGLPLMNPALDTYELSTVLLPGLPTYSLASVASHLDVAESSQHRALDDASVTRQVFLHLLERASSRRPELLEQIVGLVGGGSWPLRIVFEEALRRSARTAFTKKSSESSLQAGIGDFGDVVRGRMGDRGQILRPHPSPSSVSESEVHSTFAADGRLARSLPDYVERPQQIAMSVAVAQTLSDGGQLVVEAGTGTGKSLAYLAPAIKFAVANADRVVISTNTINLQDQLFSKDIPSLEESVGVPFRSALVKGRNNYLCLLRWAEYRQRSTATALESRLIVKVLLWLSDTLDGDVAGLNLTAEEAALWWHICCTQETCINDACVYKQRHACFLFNARRKAESAHLVIVNHSLLLSDLASDSQVLPEYVNLVIDEAHHLEDEATSQLGFELDARSMALLLGDIASRADGGRGGLAQTVRAVATRLGDRGQRPLARADELERSTDRARLRSRQLFQAIRSCFERERRHDERGDAPMHRRIVQTTRASHGWETVQSAWHDLDTTLVDVQGGLERLHLELGVLDPSSVDSLESMVLSALSLSHRIVEIRSKVQALIDEPYGNEVDWVTLEDADNTKLHSAPLHVGELLQSLLYSTKRAIVLTSATMSVNGSFDYVKERLGLDPDATAHLIGSPFDYRRQALIYIPDDIPEPNQPGYQQAVEQALFELVIASRGRALVLFTSHAALRATHAALKEPLEREGIVLLGQNLDGSRRQLLNMLRTHPNTVVLGSSSFWEGVDVAGPALSALVIVRLPFSVPSDPVFAARSETFVSPFNEYAVPQAVLRFKQGFGRLIRTSTDRGVVLLLDKRVTSKPYGQTFLRSIPTCAMRRGSSAGIERAVQSWLGTASSP